jgi:hypothetical protein
MGANFLTRVLAVRVRVLFQSALLGGAMLFGIAAMAPAGPAPAAPRAGLMALGGLERGQWELREKGSHVPPRRICIGDPAQLLQVQHPGASCRRFVVMDAANHAIVTYQCTDTGAGRTDLRVETPRLVQIDAQGVADSAPFSIALEGRKTGECK